MRGRSRILRGRSGYWAGRIVVIVLAMLWGSSVCQAGSDTLVTANGDRLVGEVKKLERGILRFDTDYADQEFTIEWKLVRRLTSDALLDIELEGGVRYVGSLRMDPGHPERLVVGSGPSAQSVLITDIVRIESVEKGFWERLNASVDLGYTLTKANDSQQSTTRGSLGYRSENWRLGGQFSSVQNRVSEAPETRKADASADFQQRIVARWFGFVGGTYAMSDEQRLDARYTAHGGAGNYLIATSELDLLVSAGLTWMEENFQDAGVPNEGSLEGLVSAEFNAFDIGDLDILATLSAHPNLQDTERVRGKFSLDLKWELPLDFTFKIGLTLDYDSKPPNEASMTDYVLSTTFGWEL